MKFMHASWLCWRLLSLRITMNGHTAWPMHTSQRAHTTKLPKTIRYTHVTNGLKGERKRGKNTPRTHVAQSGSKYKLHPLKSRIPKLVKLKTTKERKNVVLKWNILSSYPHRFGYVFSRVVYLFPIINRKLSYSDERKCDEFNLG